MTKPFVISWCEAIFDFIQKGHAVSAKAVLPSKILLTFIAFAQRSKVHHRLLFQVAI